MLTMNGRGQRQAVATRIWRRLDLPGHEHVRLSRRGPGWVLEGTAVFLHEALPVRLDYRIDCNHRWRTRHASVVGWSGERRVDLHLDRNPQGRWRINGDDHPAVAGCDDVDLGFSPATNLLPIRRLELDVGQAAAVCAAWLTFPALEVEPLEQVYRRTAPQRYQYESGGGAFMTDLAVDKHGMVLEYPDLWIAEGPV